jgi:hypothetical protein
MTMRWPDKCISVRAFLVLFAALQLAQPASSQSQVSSRIVNRKFASKDRYQVSISYPLLNSRVPVCRLANSLLKEKISRQERAFVGSQEVRASKRGSSLWLETQWDLSIANDQFVSTYGHSSTYYGGVHDVQESATLNVGLVKGKPKVLTVWDLCKDPAKDSERLRALVLKRVLQISTDKRFEDVKGISNTQLNRFVVTRGGIAWIFNPYEIAPFSQGTIQVKITFADLLPYLNPNGPLRPLLNAQKNFRAPG